MRYALYPGCTIQAEQFGYEASVREVLPRLGIELVDMEGVSCCGFAAFRCRSVLGWLYLSTRNLAIAEGLGLDVLPLCNGCHLSFSETKDTLRKDEKLGEFINKNLEKEGLKYTGKANVIHIIELLHDIIGSKKIGAVIKRPLKEFQLAAHPGCHTIRPSTLRRPDDAENPQKLDDLIAALGAGTMDYPEKTDCCGSLLAMASGRAALMIAGEKLRSVKEYGFDGLVTTCPFCFKVFDSRQRAIQTVMGDRSLVVPVFYYTQLLGLAMAIKPERLGLELNLSPVDGILEKIGGGND